MGAVPTAELSFDLLVVVLDPLSYVDVLPSSDGSASLCLCQFLPVPILSDFILQISLSTIFTFYIGKSITNLCAITIYVKSH